MNRVKNEIDPFTLEVVKDSLLATGDEMFIALAKTSMSPIIYEVLDYASGLTDNKGQLLTQGNGVTGFIGMLSYMVKQTIEKYDNQNDLNPGDIIIINDPYNGGGSHLSDVGLVMPIFYEDELIAFSANKAHWTEVGGKDPGSFTNDSVDIFQEGLQFTSLKLFNKGKINEELVEIIKSNVRFPDLSLGDMWAQVAALKTGERRVRELCEQHATNTIKSAISYHLKNGETISRKELSKLPKGTYKSEGFVESDGIGNGPFPIQVEVNITEDEFICDFRGSSVQVPGPVNCSFTGLASAVRTIFLAITNPEQDVNDGVFNPLKILVDEGSIMSAERPAPTSNYFETMLACTDLIWKALASYIPSKLAAAHLLSVCSVTLSGNHQETNEPFLIVEPSVGGWGGAEGQDGASGQFCILDGETYNVPVEVAETRYGVIIDEYSLRTGVEGAGEFTGGKGVTRSYRALTNNQAATITFGRHQFPLWGINGGHNGSTNRFFIDKNDKSSDGPYGVYPRYPLNKNDVLRLETATGGGYGNPLNRPPEKVLMDVKNEYYSIEDAKSIYGIIIDSTTFEYTETEARKNK